MKVQSSKKISCNVKYNNDENKKYDRLIDFYYKKK